MQERTQSPIHSLRHGLEDDLPGRQLVYYSLQHLVFFLANAAILPVIVGGYLELDQAGLAQLVQRTFLLCGLASFLQVVWGHRFPIFEGPAGMWYGVYITLAISAPSLGKPIEVLRTDIEMGLLIAGAVCIFLGAVGLVGRVVKIFSPIVNGVFLILMSIQLCPTMMRGLLGIIGSNQSVDIKFLAASIISIVIIMVISLKGKGIWPSIAILIGAAFGWIISIWIEISIPVKAGADGIGLAGIFFPWGAPTFDPGIVLTCVLAAVIVFSNLIASIIGLSTLTGLPLNAKAFNRGGLLTGISDVLAGAGAVVGFIPYASAIGFTAMTGVATRKPFILASLLLASLGMVPSIGSFFAGIPLPVGYSVMFVVYVLIFGLGIKEFSKVSLGNTEMFIIGVSCLLGIGVMFMPPVVFAQVPSTLRYLVLNGLVDGVVACIILEQMLMSKSLGISLGENIIQGNKLR